MEYLKDLPGLTGFLNGEEGLHDPDQQLYDNLRESGNQVVILDHLFEHPERLKLVKDCDNLVLFTTGLNAEKVSPLMDAFAELQYVPKNVVFLSENTALSFSDLARKLLERGTKFWYVFLFNKQLRPVGWL